MFFGAIARMVILFTGVAALVMVLMLAVLLVRRGWKQRSDSERAAVHRTQLEMILIALAGPPGIERTALLGQAAAAASVAVIVHLLRLLRGEERDALLTAATQARKFDRPLADIGSHLRKRQLTAMRILEVVGSDSSLSALGSVLRGRSAGVVKIQAAIILCRAGWALEAELLCEALDLANAAATIQHTNFFQELAAANPATVHAMLGQPLAPTIRAKLVEALAADRSRATLALLETFANDRCPAVRCSALKASAVIAHPRALRWIRRCFGDEDVSVRAAALQTFLKIASIEDYHALEAFNQESDPSVRSNVMRALLKSRQRRPSPRRTLAEAG